MSGVAAIVHVIAWVLLANIGIEFYTCQVVDSLPEQNTIKNRVFENTVDILILTRSSIKKNLYVDVSVYTFK